MKREARGDVSIREINLIGDSHVLLNASEILIGPEKKSNHLGAALTESVPRVRLKTH